MAKTKGKSKGKPAKKSAKPAAKAPKSTRVTKPAQLPAAAPLPPPPLDELPAPRDVGRLTRYGERFGTRKIDVRMWTALGSPHPTQLPVASGALAIFDPAAPKTWRVFERPVGTGQFRIMLSIACSLDGREPERLAAVVIHCGRPPIARWSVAHYKGQHKPKSADQLPRCTVTSGWLALMDGNRPPGVVAVPPTTGILPVEVPLTDGRRVLALPCGNGEFAAYWAVDAQDKPICIVIDFDVFSQKDWKARAT